MPHVSQCEYSKHGECRHPDVLALIDGPYKSVNSELCLFGVCEDYKPNNARPITQPMTTIAAEQALPLLKTGDLVFYRITRRWNLSRIFENIVSWWQNSPYVHVGIIEVKDGKPWIIDMTSTKNGRQEPLADDLVDYDVDIYRVNRDFNKRIHFTGECVDSITHQIDFFYVLHQVKEYCKKKYSWKANLRLFLERRFGYDTLTNDEACIRAVNCATVIEAAFNDCGFDLCPRCSPRFATPDRLAKSALIDYLFTISDK
jgi:hypothetical protein